jgi:hypothetical protein
VSAAESGDYYQVNFEAADNGDGPYVLVQRGEAKLDSHAATCVYRQALASAMSRIRRRPRRFRADLVVSPLRPAREPSSVRDGLLAAATREVLPCLTHP